MARRRPPQQLTLPSERIRLTAPAAVFVTYWMEGWTLAASIEPCIPHVSNFAPYAVACRCSRVTP